MVQMANLTAQDGEALAFLHVTKTGGRTLEHILKRMLRPQGGKSFNFDGSLRSYESFVNSSPEVRSSYDLLHGHFQFGIHYQIDRDVRYVTLLRNPADRVISQYYHILEEPRHYLHEKVTTNDWSLIDFIQNSLPRDADNGSIRSLNERLIWNGVVGDVSSEELATAKENLFESIEVFGITERFDESLILMAERFGWPDESLQYERRNTTKTRPLASDLTPEEHRAVEKITHLEKQLYEHACERFNQIVCEQPGSFRDRVDRFVARNPGSRAVYNDRGVRIDGVHCSQS